MENYTELTSIKKLQELSQSIEAAQLDVDTIENRFEDGVLIIESGGTGGDTLEEAKENLEIGDNSEALAVAQEALETANAASTTATSAAESAESAMSAAETAQSDADEAMEAATAAQSTANTASSNASSALTTANTASSNASSALSTANTINNRFSSSGVLNATYGGTGVTSISALKTALGVTSPDLSAYMTKAAPTGTGSFSMNRLSGSSTGNYSSTLNYNNTASGSYSHAEGYITTASGDQGSHAEGYRTKATTYRAHAEGYQTTASGQNSHAEGAETYALGLSSHSEGHETLAFGEYSHSEGYSQLGLPSGISDGTINSSSAIITAWNSQNFLAAVGKSSHAEGGDCLASGNYSHAEGIFSVASGTGAHAENSGTASGYYSHAEGSSSVASGSSSHAEGFYTKASGEYSHAGGYRTTASGFAQTVVGQYNNTNSMASGSANDGTKTLFVVGAGDNTNGVYNALRVNGNGQLYAAKTSITTGADYAEYFEWADSNPDSEDRVGCFVTFEESSPEQIRIANSADDYFLGIVSGVPSVIGNGDEEWRGRWFLDDFGRIKTEKIEVWDEELEQNIVVNKKILNPDYDPNLHYISRDERPEWSAVGMLGVLSVRDDGTCQVNGHCKCADGGIATAAPRGENTYRVIKRVSDNVVKVVFR